MSISCPYRHRQSESVLVSLSHDHDDDVRMRMTPNLMSDCKCNEMAIHSLSHSHTNRDTYSHYNCDHEIL